MMRLTTDVQFVVAETLRQNPWFEQNRVQIIEQNKADLKYLLDKQVGALKNVVLVVGVDSLKNQHPAIEAEVTVSTLEYVPLNRAGGDGSFVTAIEAAEAAVEILDGGWWHFFDLSHETPAERVLTATATFRGLVNRDGGDSDAQTEET